MAMTYNSLISQVRATLGVSDPILDSYIPNFIAQAQERICRAVVSLEMLETTTLLVASQINFVVKPPRWKRPLACYYQYQITPTSPSIRIQLDWRTADFMNAYAPSVEAPTKEQHPLFWGDYSMDKLMFCPMPIMPLATPNETLTVQYYATPRELTAIQNPLVPGPGEDIISAPTNLLTAKAPNALLYGTLLEAAPFMRDDNRIQVWNQLFESAIAGLNQQDQLNKQDRSSNRAAE